MTFQLRFSDSENKNLEGLLDPNFFNGGINIRVLLVYWCITFIHQDLRYGKLVPSSH